MTEGRCIHDLLFSGQDGRSVAIEAPGRVPLSYDRLREHVSGIVGTLDEMGYSRNDRIAVVLPNGPEMATAFLSVAAGFTCAPLNPLYSRHEFEFYLADLRANALLAPAEETSPAIEAARELNVPVIGLKPLHAAGLFELSGRNCTSNGGQDFAGPEDTAIVLHTSGTTSRPKRVPLTQANICASAYNIAGSLRLSPADRCLNVMPLFHIHGLIGALLSTMAAGGSVVCTPGFIATEFMGWMRELNPTWYTAVPTIHQKVLELAKGDPTSYNSLRFIRSASSALPVSLLRVLGERFGVPVIEAYGMTEASHQIAANPLPPLAQKPGSVGLPWGTEVAILDEKWKILPGGKAGEVAIRGPGVTSGYEGAPEANAAVFQSGWLRTGDTGYMDANGYLHLLGRIKEVINRGGEKISPFEVEDALLAHPKIKEAAVFPVKGGELGEEVGAAVVAREKLDVSELKDFLSVRLAYFKIPCSFVFVDEIPKGPTGKVQRAGMAEKLGLRERQGQKHVIRDGPDGETEKMLIKIWSEVLRKVDIHASDNFLELGGDSLLATQVVSRIRQACGIEVPIVCVIDAETLSGLASEVERRRLKLGGPRS